MTPKPGSTIAPFTAHTLVIQTSMVKQARATYVSTEEILQVTIMLAFKALTKPATPSLLTPQATTF
jgi:hypothetical protein